MSDATSTAEQSACCLNCGTPWQGAYCHACGQRRPLARLTMPALSRDLIERIVNLEQGLLRTFWGLLVRPRETVQAYLDGQRKKLSHPFAFLLIAATLSVLSVNLFGESFWIEFRSAVSAGVTHMLNPAQVLRFQDYWVMLFGILPYWMLIYSFPTALLVKLFFRRSGFTLAELWVAVMFGIGLAIAVDIPVTAVLVFSGISMTAQMNVTQLLLMLAQCWVLGQVLGPGVWPWLRVALVMVLSTAISMVLQSTIAMTYAHWPTQAANSIAP